LCNRFHGIKGEKKTTTEEEEKKKKLEKRNTCLKSGGSSILQKRRGEEKRMPWYLGKKRSISMKNRKKKRQIQIDLREEGNKGERSFRKRTEKPKGRSQIFDAIKKPVDNRIATPRREERKHTDLQPFFDEKRNPVVLKRRGGKRPIPLILN